MKRTRILIMKIDENDLYDIDNISLDKKKENTEWRKSTF